MILFVNVFITNKRFCDIYSDLNNDRKVSKFDIFKYALASYTVIPWEEAIFYIELDDEFKDYEKELKFFIEDNFPKYKYNDFRISTYDKWQEELNKIKCNKDDWIFFTCNDDHVFIDSSLNALEKMVSSASIIDNVDKEKVAISITHWPEAMGQRRSHSFMNKLFFHNYHSKVQRRVLKENENFFVLTGGSATSMQIVTKSLLIEWFSCTKPLPEDLRRTNSLSIPKDQVTMYCYRELVRHYDVYSHVNISHKIFPPMFIPSGFFEKNIKIQFGGDKRMNSFVYLHPSKEMMTTEEPHTKRKSDEFCDSNIFLEEIPLFWKRRISSIKEVEKFTSHELRINYAKRKIKEMCCSPMLSYTPAQVAEKFLFLIDKDNKLTKGDLKAILNDVYNLKDRIRKNIDDINYILWFNPKYRESLRRFVESRLFYLYKVYKLMKSSLKLIRR